MTAVWPTTGLALWISTTGEIRELAMNGIESEDDGGTEWELSPLEAVLAHVPAIVEALEGALSDSRGGRYGRHLVLHFKLADDDPEAFGIRVWRAWTASTR